METEAVEGDLDWLTDDDLEGEADIPDWLREQVDDTVTAGETMPDWLNEEDIDIDTDDVPAWLRETMDEEQEVIPAEQQLPARDEPKLPEPDRPELPEPDTAQPAASIEPAAKSPAPVPAAAADIDVDSTLSSARESVTRDAVDDALHNYEQLIRANAALDNVENDLAKLTEKHKKNPAVFRLLGDAKMRQGKLQDALDIYRRALNML
jgi:tetratricopeptide (TPR) repeat protein